MTGPRGVRAALLSLARPDAGARQPQVGGTPDTARDADHDPDRDTARDAAFADAGSAAALRMTGVGHRYRRVRVLRDCSLTVPAGSVTALVGPNGAGKSTLFELATDLRRPEEGRIEVFGAAPGSPAARRRTALLPQRVALYPRFSVADTLRWGRASNDTWDQAAAERLVRSAGIGLRERVGALSAGQRTRVALALVLGRRPDLLLLDEPLADLDPLARHRVLGDLMAEASDRGMTIVLASHVVPELADVCDHLLLLAGGRVRLAGDVDEVLSRHAVLTGRAADDRGPDGPELAGHTVVEHRTVGRQARALVRLAGPVRGEWLSEQPGLEELLLGYLRSCLRGGPRDGVRLGRPGDRPQQDRPRRDGLRRDRPRQDGPRQDDARRDAAPRNGPDGDARAAGPRSVGPRDGASGGPTGEAP